MPTYTSFADAYDNGVVGQNVTVSDGTTPPRGGHNTREFQEWRGRNFNGTLVSRSAGPPRSMVVTLSSPSVSVTVTEPIERGADVTAHSAPRLEGTNSTVVYCDYQGAAKDGELPKTFQIKRFRGMTDVSSSSTWSVSAANMTASISSAGVVSIDTFTTSGTVTVTSVRDGVTLVRTIEVTARLENPPIQQPVSSGSQTTQAATSTFAMIAASATSAGTATTIVSPTLKINAPPNTHYVQISAPLTYAVHVATSTDNDGLAACMMKVQYRDITANGVWTDAVVPTAWASLTTAQKEIRRHLRNYLTPPVSSDTKDGSITLNGTISAGALTATNQIEFRIVGWREYNEQGLSGPFYIKSGSFTVQWMAV